MKLSFSLKYKVCAKSTKFQKLYLPRQKSNNKTLIFLKIVPLPFNTFIPAGLSWFDVALMLVGNCIIVLYFLHVFKSFTFGEFSISEQREKLYGDRGMVTIVSNTLAPSCVLPKIADQKISRL